MSYKVFPYVEFLRDHGFHFEYRDGKDEIETSCQFCDHDHTGKMMGINLATGQYGCWWSGSHRGASPVRFVMQWAGCTKPQAIAIVNEATGSKLEDLVGMLETWGVDFEEEEPEEKKVLDFPDSFVIISHNRRRHHKFTRYLSHDRGFANHDVERLINMYGFRCSEEKDIWNYRLIVPVYEGGELLTWQGRDVGDSDLRWLSLSEKKELGGSLAAGNIKHTIYNIDNINKGGDVLIVSEGVFDAVKVDFYGYKYKVRAGCLFGKATTDEQLFLLQEAAKKYKVLIFVLDEGTGVEDAILAMKFPRAKFEPVPYNLDDLGELSPKQAKRFARDMRKKYTMKRSDK